MELHKIPLFYISFTKKEEIENHYKKNGFTDINHFPAIDGRKLDIEDMAKKNLISVRSYDDLIFNRSEHSGLPSKGAIGCSLSHYKLWNICIERDLPYIIIAEDDNRLFTGLTESDIQTIGDILKKPKSIYMSTKIDKTGEKIHFFGTHFYIISREACRELVKDFFPLDVQVDWYMAHKGTLGHVNIEGYPISKQTTPIGKSTIQDVCITCMLPRNKWFYFSVIFLIIILILVGIMYRNSFKECVKSCSSSRSE